MSTLSKCRFVRGLIAGVFLSSAALALGGDGGKGALSPAPQEEPRLKVGNTLVIAADSAKLVVGNEVVATVPKGQRIIVVEVRDAWVGTYVSVGGQNRGGWIGTANFVPAGSSMKSEPHNYTASQSIVSEPAENTAKVRVCKPARSDLGDDYFRDYYIGYYIRHETDPNIHVWEPWNR